MNMLHAMAIRRSINPTYYSLINDELWSLNVQGVGNWINDLAKKNNLKGFKVTCPSHV